MFNAIVLSHLPKKYLTIIRDSPVKNLSQPPALSTIADVLIKGEIDKVEAWKTIDHMQRLAEETSVLMSQKRIQFVDFWSEHFPQKLKKMPQNPWGLYFIGNLPSAAPTLSVVGTRNPNRYGLEVLSQILGRLTRNNFEHVSGLAYGVDSIAHQITMKMGVRNFAVLGSGIDMLYPSEHADLARGILDAGGGILSEFPPGTAAQAWHFPWRNRIIAALADVVWIPQGSKKSGSAHTALWAHQMERQLLATPGDIFSELSALPHELLDYENVKSVLSAADLESYLRI